MFENGVDGTDEPERLEDNLDALYLGATTRHQWQVLVSTLAASKKEHAEKKAKDKRDLEMSKGIKLNKKLLKLNRSHPQNLVSLSKGFGTISVDISASKFHFVIFFILQSFI